MRRFDVRVIGGILLILGGILLLLQNLGFPAGPLAFLWAVLPGAGGAVFLYLFVADRAKWWAVIPGFALLSLAALIPLNEFLPDVGDAFGGGLLLGAIGLAFWVVCLANREQWWAVIPGGVLLTLGVVAGLSSILPGIDMGGPFFVGLGVTFALLSVLPTPQGRMRWALIPAAVLLVMGLVMTAAATGILKYLWPAALILVGLYLIFRLLRSRA